MLTRSLLPLPARTTIWLDAKSTSWIRSRGTLEEAQAGTVHEDRHQPRRTLELVDDSAHLGAGEHHRQPLRALRTYHIVEPREVLLQDVPIEEEEGAQRLILRRGGHVAIDGQRGQKSGNLSPAHLGGMTPTVKQDVPAHPRDVGLLRSSAEVSRAHGLADSVEQPRLGRLRRRRCLAHGERRAGLLIQRRVGDSSTREKDDHPCGPVLFPGG
jgi:hypothetical protein